MRRENSDSHRSENVRQNPRQPLPYLKKKNQKRDQTPPHESLSYQPSIHRKDEPISQYAKSEIEYNLASESQSKKRSSQLPPIPMSPHQLSKQKTRCWEEQQRHGKKRIKSLSSQIAQLKAKIKETEEHLTETKDEITDLQAQLEWLQIQIVEEQGVKKKIQLNASKKKVEDRIYMRKKTLEVIRKDLKQLESQNIELQKDLQIFKKYVAEKRQQIDAQLCPMPPKPQAIAKPTKFFVPL